MELLLFSCFTVLISSGCYTEYKFTKKRVIVNNRLNYRNKYIHLLFYSSKPNIRIYSNSNNNKYKSRIK